MATKRSPVKLNPQANEPIPPERVTAYAPAHPGVDVLHDTQGVDQLMISSLPPMASGADVYMRQFYRDSRLPQRRYLPIRGQ